jgi:hypothetical protein
MLSDIILNVGADTTGTIGTGLNHNKKDINQVKTLLLWEKGTIFDDSQSLNKAYVQGMQQQEKCIVLQGVVEFTDNTADPNIGTRTGSGIKRKLSDNPNEYTIKFDNALNFYKALTYLEGFNQWDLSFLDSKGDHFFTQTKAGDCKGFSLGMFANGKYVVSNGADFNEQSITIQLINPEQVRKRITWVDSDNLDYSYEDLDGWNDIVVTMTSPADAATTIDFTVFSAPDNTGIAIQGLTDAMLSYTVNGSETSKTLAAVSPGHYTLTVAAVSTGQALKLKTNTLSGGTPANCDVINASGVLYKSNESSTVVA